MNSSPKAAIVHVASSNKSMNLEQARKVMWLPNSHKTMGELLDKGYLDQLRLEWATEKASDPTIKQAAKVLLDWRKRSSSKTTTEKKPTTLMAKSTIPPIKVGITVDQACATPWPFGTFKGQPMGILAETRQVSLKDLVYLIENAWEERVRQSAIVLALLRLNQEVKEPARSTGALNVISGGRSYSERKQYSYILLEGLLFGIVFSSLIFYLVWNQSNISSTNPSISFSEFISTPMGILPLVIGLTLIISGVCLLILGFNFVVNKLDKEIANFRKGKIGEDRVVEAIYPTLDGNWFLFRNVILPGRNKADIDAVLVGPSGVWVLESKYYEWEFKNIGEQWWRRAGKGWKQLSKSPSRQAKDNAAHLANFLKADGITQWVNAAVVWANRESPLTVENPAVAVWQFDRLSDELGNIWNDKPVPQSTQEKIIAKLTALCKRQEKESLKV